MVDAVLEIMSHKPFDERLALLGLCTSCFHPFFSACDGQGCDSSWRGLVVWYFFARRGQSLGYLLFPAILRVWEINLPSCFLKKDALRW